MHIHTFRRAIKISEYEKKSVFLLIEYMPSWEGRNMMHRIDYLFVRYRFGANMNTIKLKI